MDSKSLGLRIKEARLAKKMTQSEVVGTFITRNMLSQIESGNAVPSMKTLTYLAEVLGLSPAILLQDETLSDAAEKAPEEVLSGISENNDMVRYLTARQRVLDKNWKEALELLTPLCTDSSFYEESKKLTCRCAMELAKEQEASGDLIAALESAKLAEQSSEGLFASSSDKTESLLLLSKIAAALAAPH